MDGVNIKNLAGVRRDRQRQVMYRFFAFDVAPHHRLASPDQFRYGRHHLAKPHERTPYPRIHHFVMMTNGTELFVSFQLERPLAQRIPESGSFLDRGERHERFAVYRGVRVG
ncbi:hypothetical protein SeMB42_g06917 [Synchytrium endobioticum]|uniref:Uncharacterized protein n=1 Tax=Synchytrium endobioticum TaxID=286115 RepID=A0A507C706_9FUNG|nr:hypothetical protein SeMB42_g06917 [Synchytrium endobioticum]